MLKIMKAPNKLLEEDIDTASLFNQDTQWYASIKYDGLRTIIMDGKVLSSSGKETYNNPALRLALQPLCDYSQRHNLVFDGELCDPTIPCSQHLTWKSAKRNSVPEQMKFRCIEILPKAEWDYFASPFATFLQIRHKYIHLEELVPIFTMIQQRPLTNYAQFTELIKTYNDGKHEGFILRNANSQYKHGRATVKERTFFKFKYLDTLDAKIIGYFPRRELKTGVPRERNVFGELAPVYTIDAYKETQMLGGFDILLEDGTITKCRPPIGLTLYDYTKMWKERETYLNRWVTFKKMSLGEKDKPRLIKNVQFRDDKANTGE